MKNKKVFMYIIIILLLLFVLWIGVLVLKKNNLNKEKTISEYTPEMEITEEQLRKTNINLYFEDKITGQIKPEIRQIDSKSLLVNPEQILINYLIEGPNSEDLLKLMPDNTKLIDIKLDNEILLINFSEDFINNQALGEEKELKIIDSILKTVSELNEISGIKILINEEGNRGFPDNGNMFDKIFTIRQRD